MEQNHWTEIKKSSAASWQLQLSQETEISGIWKSIKKLLSCEGWYLHNLLERSEQQEASFDVAGCGQITALLKTALCDALTSGHLLKWPVWLKVVNSKREFQSWVAIRIYSKKPHITRLLAMKEKPTLIFHVLLSLKWETQYCSGRWLVIWEQRYFCFHQMIMYLMMLVIMRGYKSFQEVNCPSSSHKHCWPSSFPPSLW